MFSTLLLAGAVWLDFVSLARWVRLRKTGRGAGGIPLLSWLIYAWVCLGSGRWLLFAGLTAYHLACHMYIPMRYRLWAEATRRPLLK